MLLESKSFKVIDDILNEYKDYRMIYLRKNELKVMFKDKENCDRFKLEDSFNDLIIKYPNEVMNLDKIPYHQVCLKMKDWSDESNFIKVGSVKFSLNKGQEKNNMEGLIFLVKKDVELREIIRLKSNIFENQKDVDEYINKFAKNWNEEIKRIDRFESDYLIADKCIRVYPQYFNDDFRDKQMKELTFNQVVYIISESDLMFFETVDKKLNLLKKLIEKKVVIHNKNLLEKLVDVNLLAELNKVSTKSAYLILNMLSESKDFSENKVKMKKFFNVIDEKYKPKMIDKFLFLKDSDVDLSNVKQKWINEKSIEVLLNITKDKTIHQEIFFDVKEYIKEIVEGTFNDDYVNIEVLNLNGGKYIIQLEPKYSLDKDYLLLKQEIKDKFFESIEMLCAEKERFRSIAVVDFLESKWSEKIMRENLHNSLENNKSKIKIKKF